MPLLLLFLTFSPTSNLIILFSLFIPGQLTFLAKRMVEKYTHTHLPNHRVTNTTSTRLTN